MGPTRTQTQPPGQRQIRDTEETKRSVSVESAFTRTLMGPTRTQTQPPGQRQIRDTEETKRSVSVESAFTRTLMGPRPNPNPTPWPTSDQRIGPNQTQTTTSAVSELIA